MGNNNSVWGVLWQIEVLALTPKDSIQSQNTTFVICLILATLDLKQSLWGSTLVCVFAYEVFT